MSKQDWLDYFEAVNGRSASAEEIAQALAAGEFQEEVVAPEAPVQEPVSAPQAPEFVAAPEAPVQEPVSAPQAPDFVAAPEVPVQEPVSAPQGPAPQTAPNNGTAFQQAPQQAYQQPTQAGYQQPGQAGYQQVPFQGQPGQPYPAQPSQFGIAVGGYWNWFLSALKRPTTVAYSKAINGILQYVLTAFVMTLGAFFTTSGFTGGYGMDFSAFMLILIALFFTIYAFQVAGFFVRRVLLQDKEYSYGRSFEEFGRLSVYNLPIAILAFLVGLVKVYEFYGFLNYLIFFLFLVGTCYVVHQGLNKTSLKADKYLLLVASSVVLLLIAILVGYIDSRILEQIFRGFIPSISDIQNFGF